MSYVRRRNSVHFYINGHRVRKDVFWRWFSGGATILLLVLLAFGWTVYRKDAVIHQAASQLLDRITHR